MNFLKNRPTDNFPVVNGVNFFLEMSAPALYAYGQAVHVQLSIRITFQAAASTER